jgi:uncharacterized alpha-E superfamily protein
MNRGGMLSRVAALAYWTARYLERAENNVRLVDVNAQLALDIHGTAEPSDPESWAPLLLVFGDDALFRQFYPSANEINVVRFVVFDRRNPSSVSSCIAAARENCRCMREQVASEIWEQLNRLYLLLPPAPPEDCTAAAVADHLAAVRDGIQLLYGLLDSLQARHDGFWFFDLGRQIERADSSSRIIDVKYFTLLPSVEAVGSAVDLVQWASVLRSCSGFEAFRRTRAGQMTLPRIVDFLVCDPLFPRSIRFAVGRAREALDRISANGTAHADNSAETELRSLHDALVTVDTKQIIASGLHEFLDDLQTRLGRVHDAVQRTFIDYPIPGARVLE